MWNAFESKLDWELHMTIVNSCNYPMSFQALQMFLPHGIVNIQYIWNVRNV